MNPADILRDIVVTAGIASGWNTSIAREPDSPDKALTFYNTGGLAPNPKWLMDYPSIQVRVRGDKNAYATSRAKAQAIKDKLLGLESQDVGGGIRLSSTLMVGDIVDLGYDSLQRPLHTMNFRLIIHPASGTNRQALA